MKSFPIAHVAPATLAVFMMAFPPAFAQTTSPSIPIGSLTAFPTVVQTGTKPTLTWAITYPSIVQDFVTITRTTSQTGTVTPKVNLICDVRILGAGVTTQNSNGSINYIQTKGMMRYNGATNWTTVFDGKNTAAIVQQQGIVKTISVTKDQPINFGGQYYWNSAWSTFRASGVTPSYVWSLVNGDACPGRIPDYNAPSLESFLKPYLNASKKVRIGPMDVIVFMELTHTNTADVGYDQQDLVFLVTFRVP